MFNRSDWYNKITKQVRDKPHRNGDKQMKYLADYVIADIMRQKLMVPRYVMEHVHELTSPEAGLVNEYLGKYPGFQIEVFDCDPVRMNRIPDFLR